MHHTSMQTIITKSGSKTGRGFYKPNQRLMLNGDTVKVTDAKKDHYAQLTKGAIIGANKSPDNCAIARQLKLDTGHRWEIYRYVAFEQISKTKALRYTVPGSSRNVLVVNDVSYNAKSDIVRRLVGYIARLRSPAPCHTLATQRAAMAASRKAKKAGGKRTGTKVNKPSVAYYLQLRDRALP